MTDRYVYKGPGEDDLVVVHRECELSDEWPDTVLNCEPADRPSRRRPVRCVQKASPLRTHFHAWGRGTMTQQEFAEAVMVGVLAVGNVRKSGHLSGVEWCDDCAHERCAIFRQARADWEREHGEDC